VNDCHRGGREPLDDAVILMSVQVLLDDSHVFSDILSRESKNELDWEKVCHYIWFVTGLVRSQKAWTGLWNTSGKDYADLKALCTLALHVLVSVLRRDISVVILTLYLAISSIKTCNRRYTRYPR
jgi:hypothetical protein